MRTDFRCYFSESFVVKKKTELFLGQCYRQLVHLSLGDLVKTA